MGDLTEGKVEQYLRLLEQGISDPTITLSPEPPSSPDAVPSPPLAASTPSLSPNCSDSSAGDQPPTTPITPTPGYYGRPGARLPTTEESLRTYKQQGWVPAVAGPHEESRLQVLERFNLSKTVEAHLAIDRIVDLASTVFRCPIVVVSLVQEDQELFVATLGWDKVSCSR